MGGEKVGKKDGGFFHMFDWNKKSRKKLFSNGTVSPEGTKQGKRSDDSLPKTRLHLIDEDEIVGVSSVKGSSDYSCASSVTDEEGNGIRAPGVVARLMGLNSLPTSGVSEPYSTPIFGSRYLQDNRSQKRTAEFYINDQFNHVVSRAEGFNRKTMESRSQKMPSSPIERFQTETLPPRSARSLPLTHHKLLSPIKKSGFISAKNAAHIMEAAAKIIEPGLQANTKGKTLPFGQSSIPLKVRDSKEIIEASQSASMLLESSRRPVESTAVRYLRGQSMNRSWNGVEDITLLRSSPESDETSAAGAKNKGKSISLAVQAKVNVQRREGLSTCSRSNLVKDHDEYKSNQPLRSQLNNQKNKQQKRTSTTNPSGVLRQNNQKQNCSASKDKLASKPLISSQQGRKAHSGDASSVKSTTVNRLSGNSKVCHRKDGLGTTDLKIEGPASSNTNIPRKKRLIEGAFHSERSGFIDNMLADRHEKCVQPNVLIDENPRWTEDKRRNCADIVSFTFTSPMIKPMLRSRASTQAAEKWDKTNGYYFDAHSEKNALDTNSKKVSSLKLNVIDGDALSILLEQKLREITSGDEPSYCNSVEVGNVAASAPAEHEKEFLLRSFRHKFGGTFDPGLSSTNGQGFGISHKLQGWKVECSSSSDARKERDHQHPSPLSILEASFSNESCNSSESWDSTKGSKICSSIQAQNIVSLNCENKSPSVEAELELSDSASSTFTETVDGGHGPETTRGPLKSCNQELEYVMEILCNTESMLKDLGSCHATHSGKMLDPLLFDQLENRKSRTTREEQDKDCSMRRKVLFDCVNECLDMKCSRYFRAGYQTWAKGVAVVGNELEHELYKEISGWENMGDWMVDELVDKDMSSHLGRWVDFEIEKFEAGAEIEREILSSLVDEVVTDLLIRGLCA